MRFSQVSKLEYEEKEEEQLVFNCGILFFIQTHFALPKGKKHYSNDQTLIRVYIKEFNLFSIRCPGMEISIYNYTIKPCYAVIEIKRRVIEYWEIYK